MGKRRRSNTKAAKVAKSPQVIQKSPAKSPAAKKRKVKKAKKRLSKASAVDDKALHSDVLRQLASKLVGTPTAFKLGRLNKSCKLIFDKEVSSTQWAKTIDVEQVARDNNPLTLKFYDVEDKQHRLRFHADVRRTLATLSNMVAALQTNTNCIKNLTMRAFGWQYCHYDTEIRRCPPLLQKKIMRLVRNHFTETVELEYAKALLRPSRFISTFKHRLSSITKLDLGDMRQIKATNLRRGVFPKLTNLKELVWHAAELWFVESLPFPHKLKSLCLTLDKKKIDAESMSKLLNCQGLREIYTGFDFPDNATRFDWDVLLTSYQAFWNQRQYRPADMLIEKGLEPVQLAEGTDIDYAYVAFPKLRKAAFWNTPEYLFVIMGKLGIRYEELQLGLLTQDLSRCCSLDSVMQALFKYNQPKYSINKLSVDHLKLYAHSMPVISLDYYLPNLMVALGQALPSLKTLEIFIHCLAASSGMPSSWLLESSRPKRPRPLFEDLTHFSFHMDGFCLLDDLDTYLPPSTQSVTLSFIAPKENRRRFLGSLEKFIEYLGDFNRFPELDELHIQVWGVACFEQLLNAVADHLPTLRRLSLVCLPVNKQLSTVSDLIGASANKCKNLVEFGLSAELINQLLNDKEKADCHQWRNALSSLAIRCGMNQKCCLVVKEIPAYEGWNRYTVKPILLPTTELDNDEEVEDESTSSDDATDDDEAVTEASEEEQEDEEEMDSFVVESDDAEMEESEDELDRAERELEAETTRREKRWQRRARVVSESSEQSSHLNESDVVVFRRGEPLDDDEYELEDEEEENPFLDDMAEERDGSTSAEDETEPEGEDLEGSDDEDLLMAGVEMVNAKTRRQPPPKRRRIVSSSEDEE